MKKQEQFFPSLLKMIIVASLTIMIIMEISAIFNNGQANDSDLKEWTSAQVMNTSLFYKYNLSNKDKELTPKELMEQGGACGNWAEYYQSLAKAKGYYAKLVSFDTDNETRHEVAIVSNNNSYCLIDQINYECYDMKAD
jgi:hypothetical protein